MSFRIRVPLFPPLPLPLLRTSSSSSTMASHATHLEKVINTNKKQIEISKNDESSNNKQETITRRIAEKRIANMNPILKHLGYNKPNPPRSNGIETISNKSFVMDLNKLDKTSTLEIEVSSLNESEESPSLTNVDHENKFSSPSINSGGTLRESQRSCSGEDSMEEREYSDLLDYRHVLDEHSLPTSFGKLDHRDSKISKSFKNSRKEGIYRNGYPMKKRVAPFEVFDICYSEGDGNVFLRSPIVCLDETKEPKVGKPSEVSWKIIRPGMVLLKSYLSDREQVVY